MTRGTCATCTFYHTVYGQCRLNPPTLVVKESQRTPDIGKSVPAQYESKWPTVDADDWCSGWRSAIVGGRRKNWRNQVNDGDVTP